MKRILSFAGIVLVVAALAACSPGIHTLGNSITFDSKGIVVHAPGHPDAHVDSDGDLSIDGKAVAVAPSQRRLLQRYYRQAHDTMDSAKTVGVQGVEIATHSIGAAIASIFHNGDSPAEKRVDAESNKIEAAATKLCSQIKALGTTQDEIATEIPVFAPYASNDRVECNVTHTTTYRTGGGKSTSFTYAAHDRAAATGKHVSSRPAANSGRPATSDSSQP